MGKRGEKVPRIMLRCEAAEALDVTVEGMRHLERTGQITVRQTTGGRPFYLAGDVERLRKVRAKGGK
jgi:DNA-binding transcriptional MerR regulator